MKRMIMITLLLGVCLAMFAQVNGQTRWFEDKKVVRVWGTHEERGYAVGYLIGEQVVDLFDQYFLEYLLSGNATYYGILRAQYGQMFATEQVYLDEMQAMLDGAAAAGVSLYNETLQRDVDVTDVCMVNSIIDLSSMTRSFDPSYFGCSTITSWGEATADDPALQGAIVMTRFMDWTNHQTLRENPVVIVQMPSEEDEVAWASFTYPGLIGALSAVDETGCVAMLNMGNSHALGSATDPFHPQLLSVRMGVESFDYNGDGFHTINDISDSIEDHRRCCGTIVTTLSPLEYEILPQIVESNDEAGVSVRNRQHNTEITGSNLAATNHFRTLYDPVACSRYSKIVDSLDVSALMTLERSPEMLAGAAGISNNLMAIRFDTRSQTVAFATTTDDHRAYEGPYTELTHDDLFGEWVDVDDNNAPHSGMLQLRAWPNPFNPSATVAFTAQSPCRAQVEVFDIRGRHIDTLFDGNAHAGQNRVNWNAQGLPSGVYLAKVKVDGVEETTKLLLLE